MIGRDNSKAIHNKKLADFLMLCGCRLVDIKKEESSNKFIFYFNNTEKTKRKIQVYFGNAAVDKEEE